jgi:glycosyltransferase involved in cell wall biosynthesis
MKNIILTTFIIGNKNIDLGKIPSNVEILKYTNDNNILNAKGSYISFIDSEDSITDNYFKIIIDKIKKDNFDIAYINNEINYSYKRKLKIRHTNEGITNIVPIYNPYVWNYIYKKELIPKLKDLSIKIEDIEKRIFIDEVIYIHNPNRTSTKVLNMPTRRPSVQYKNIIYVEDSCNITFNGYITWILEIAKTFPTLEITIIYTSINEITLQRFSKYFNCIEYNPNLNYTCDKLITTYSTYFYPNNIYSLEGNYIFIHGNMSDYKSARKFYDDIYDRYIAVSKIAQKTAKGYFPQEVEYIYNPYTHEQDSIRPHLKLVSAIRNSPEKGINRIKQMAAILDAENIPYTWQIFTNILEPNQGGLIFRQGIPNVIEYIADADYLVQLSSSEALAYSFVEALSCGTKIIATPLPALKELNAEEGTSLITIPFNYFEENNKGILRQKVLKAYKNKDIKFKYKYEKSRSKEYKDIFNK